MERMSKIIRNMYKTKTRRRKNGKQITNKKTNGRKNRSNKFSK